METKLNLDEILIQGEVKLYEFNTCTLSFKDKDDKKDENSQKGITGALWITTYRILFIETVTKTITKAVGNSVFKRLPVSGSGRGGGGGENRLILDKMLGMIDCFEPDKKESTRIYFRCKDFLRFSINVKEESPASVSTASISGSSVSSSSFSGGGSAASSTSPFKRIEKILSCDAIQKLPAFLYGAAVRHKSAALSPPPSESASESASAQLSPPPRHTNFGIDLEAEYTKRLGLCPAHSSSGVASWKVSRLNENYELCESYPCTPLVIPAQFSDEALQSARKHRTRNRIPILSWWNASTQAALVRSSQPAVGVMKRTNEEDQQLLTAIHAANPHSEQLIIMDARPQINAKVNVLRGGGVENSKDYCKISYGYGNIANIDCVIRAYRDLEALVNSNAWNELDEKWLAELNDTKWLSYIRQILLASLFVAEQLMNQRSVHVHCSDGWDRTAQICSLTQLMVDPFYRTFEGFAILIEKEWCAFGHKFLERCGAAREQSILEKSVANSASTSASLPSSVGSSESQSQRGSNSSSKNTEFSPIFLQFLDCVHQMQLQFPTHFEFNQRLLVFLMDAVHSGLYGNFLFNNDKQRREHRVYENTVSVWDEINANRHLYSSPYYIKVDESREIQQIFPQFMMPHLNLWNAYFLRHHAEFKLQQEEDHSSSVYDLLLSKIDLLCEQLSIREAENVNENEENIKEVLINLETTKAEKISMIQ